MSPASQKRALVLPYSLRRCTEASPSPDLTPANSPKSGSKRKLEDDAEAPITQRKTFRTYAEHRKHETHYYLDGNLLVQIGKTRFKVHRSRLTAECGWFADLLDHYNGTTPEGTTVGKDIEDIVNEADTIGDDPLLFLDAEAEKIPTPNEFAALLKAAYSGIDYVFTPPSIDEIRLLYGAAWYYTFPKYLSFADTYLQSFFPAFDKITKEPSLHNAVQAICMVDAFELEDLLPRVLHDLARAPTSALEECLTATNGAVQDVVAPLPPAANPVAAITASAPTRASTNGQQGEDVQMAEANDNNDEESDRSNKANEEPAPHVDEANIIKKIDSKHFTRILILQRQLSSAWDPIVKELMTITCTPGCGTPQKVIAVFDAVNAIRLLYPCDPLLGVQVLFKTSGLLGNYCKHMKVIMNTRLTARKAFICKMLEEKWTK